MSEYEHHFLPLDPAPASEAECDELEVLGTLNFGTKAEVPLVTRFLGTPAHCVRVIAVALPQAVKDHPDKGKWFKQIMETSVTAIRLSYDPAVQPVYAGDGFLNLMYESDDAEPRFKFPIEAVQNPDWRVNIGHVLGVFGAIHGKDKSDIAALLAESQVPSMPPHYAVLSLVRAIELLWPDERERDAILDARHEEFAALNISGRQFRNALPELRNRCAHGRGRGRGDPEPFIGLGYNNPALGPLRKLLGSIVARGFGELHDVQMAEIAKAGGSTA